jgi:hypothetical protein
VQPRCRLNAAAYHPRRPSCRTTVPRISITAAPSASRTPNLARPLRCQDFDRTRTALTSLASTSRTASIGGSPLCPIMCLAIERHSRGERCHPGCFCRLISLRCLLRISKRLLDQMSHVDSRCSALFREACDEAHQRAKRMDANEPVESVRIAFLESFREVHKGARVKLRERACWWCISTRETSRWPRGFFMPWARHSSSSKRTPRSID